MALLLAAAAVLTAVRWDDIGQSAKLGGLVALTVAMLAGGRRLRNSVPMTGQAIFHLGALLIPFDMAAVAILAGQTWQETLLLTAFTSVVGWYGIEQGEPSVLLKWCARSAVIALAAGVAAMTTLAMPLVLAIFGAVAIAFRRPAAAAMWSVTAGLLPLALPPLRLLAEWPARRLPGTEAELGFALTNEWQFLIAGVVAAATLIGVTRLVPRVEIAWAAVAVGFVTALVSFVTFANLEIGHTTVAALFLGIELLALVAKRDQLWGPVASVLAITTELLAAVGTVVVLLLSWSSAIGGFEYSYLQSPTMAVAAALVALGWLTADVRRAGEDVDWFTAIFVGANWAGTTVMFPAAVMSLLFIANVPAVVGALVVVALAYWMVATWRTGASYGAVLLVGFASIVANGVNPWLELGFGGLGAIVLALAAVLGIAKRDELAAVLAGAASIIVWFANAQSAIDAGSYRWPLAVVIAGAWALSLLVEVTDRTRQPHPVDWFGRVTALALLVPIAFAAEPIVALASALAVATLAGFEYAHGGRRETVFGIATGAAIALAAVPIVALAGLTGGLAGVALAIAGFVVLGLTFASPQMFDMPLGTAAVGLSALGLFMSSSNEEWIALALIVVGISVAFAAAALRDSLFGIISFVVVGLGVSLQLAEWDVDWVEPYLVFPALAALAVGARYQREGVTSWATYAPTIAVLSYVSLAARFTGGPAWHTVIAGAIGVFAVIAGGYRRLAGPLVTGSLVLAVVVGYESLGPAALVPTWAWLALGGTVLLSAGVAMERSDTTPLERGQQLREVVATQFS